MAKLRKPRVDRKADDRRAAAFTRLCETYRSRSRADSAPSDLNLALQGQPVVTEGLKEAYGGIKAVITALRAFDNPEAQAFITLYDSISATDRLYLSLEEIAVAADVGSSRLLGVSVEALKAYGQSVSQVILWAGMPKIVKKSVELAGEGLAYHSEMMMKAAAFVPVPKSSSVAVQVNNQLPVPEREETVRPWDPERHLQGIQAAWGETRSLPPSVEHEPLSPTLESMQERTTDVLDVG